MKGTLAPFEDQVNRKIITIYKSYREDFIGAIGYLPQEKVNSRKQTRQFKKNKVEQINEVDFEQYL